VSSARLILGLAISTLLLALLFVNVDFRALAAALAQVDPRFVAVGIGLYFVGVLVRALRWRLILRPVGDLPLARLFAVLIVGFTANDVLPARLGELARAYLLNRSHQVQVGATIASIVVERVLDGLTLCLFVVIGISTAPHGGLPHGVIWTAAAAFGIATFALWVLARPPALLATLGRIALRLAPGSAGRRLGGVVGSFASGLGVMRNGRLLLASLALSFLAWTVEASMYYVIALAFPLPVGPLAALLGVGVANLGTMLPAAPGYMGTFDVPLVAVLKSLYEVSPPLAIGYTLVVHAALVVPVVLFGLLLTWREGVSLRAVTRAPLGSDTTLPRREGASPQALK